MHVIYYMLLIINSGMPISYPLFLKAPRITPPVHFHSTIKCPIFCADKLSEPSNNSPHYLGVNVHQHDLFFIRIDLPVLYRPNICAQVH